MLQYQCSSNIEAISVVRAQTAALLAFRLHATLRLLNALLSEANLYVEHQCQTLRKKVLIFCFFFSFAFKIRLSTSFDFILIANTSLQACVFIREGNKDTTKFRGKRSSLLTWYSNHFCIAKHTLVHQFNMLYSYTRIVKFMSNWKNLEKATAERMQEFFKKWRDTEFYRTCKLLFNTFRVLPLRKCI